MNQVNARERARQAASMYKRQQAIRAKQVAAAVAAYFQADQRAATALTKLAAAEDARADAINTLTSLGETIETIAGLCGIDAADVRALRRRARSNSKAEEIETSVNDVGDQATPPADGGEFVDGQ